jgi:hypothetical protein
MTEFSVFRIWPPRYLTAHDKLAPEAWIDISERAFEHVKKERRIETGEAIKVKVLTEVEN